MMQQRLAFALSDSGRTAEKQQGHLLGPSPCDCIRHLQPADAIGRGGDAKSAKPGVGIRSKGSTLFIARDVNGEPFVIKGTKQAQGEVAHNPKSAINSSLTEATHEVTGDSEFCGRHGENIPPRVNDTTEPMAELRTSRLPVDLCIRDIG